MVIRQILNDQIEHNFFPWIITVTQKKFFAIFCGKIFFLYFKDFEVVEFVTYLSNDFCIRNASENLLNWTTEFFYKKNARGVKSPVATLCSNPGVDLFIIYFRFCKKNIAWYLQIFFGAMVIYRLFKYEISKVLEKYGKNMASIFLEEKK